MPRHSYLGSRSDTCPASEMPVASGKGPPHRSCGRSRGPGPHLVRGRMRNDHERYEPVRGENAMGTGDSGESPIVARPPASDYGSDESGLFPPFGALVRVALHRSQSAVALHGIVAFVNAPGVSVQCIDPDRNPRAEGSEYLRLSSISESVGIQCRGGSSHNRTAAGPCRCRGRTAEGAVRRTTAPAGTRPCAA